MAIIPCRECAHQVSDQAASCPSCGAPITSSVKTKPRRKHSISRVLITLMTFWTLGTVVWLVLPKGVSDEVLTRAKWALQGPDRSAGPLSTASHSNVTGVHPEQQTTAVAARSPGKDPESKPELPLRPVYRTTAEQLYRAYDANALAIQTRIGAGRVRLTGSVAAIDQDATGLPVVKLWTGDDGTAAMTLAENQRATAAQLVKGEGVDIECEKIDRSGAVLQGNGCRLEFVDTRTREVNLALLLTSESGAAHVYVVGPMPETVCRERSEEISSRLQGNWRGEHLAWRNCTVGARESILPAGCHLKSRAVTLPNLPTAHLWRYDCSSSAVARTSTAARPSALPAADANADEATAPAPDDSPAGLAVPIESSVVATAAPAVLARQVESSPSAPAPPATEHATTNNIRVASAAGGSDINTTTAAPSVPQASAAPDELAQVAAVDANAAYHIATYCSQAAASAGNRDAFIAACRRGESQAWTRLVLQNEFPTLDDATRKKCSAPPVPDTYVAKERCAQYELHAN